MHAPMQVSGSTLTDRIIARVDKYHTMRRTQGPADDDEAAGLAGHYSETG